MTDHQREQNEAAIVDSIVAEVEELEEAKEIDRKYLPREDGSLLIQVILLKEPRLERILVTAYVVSPPPPPRDFHSC